MKSGHDIRQDRPKCERYRLHIQRSSQQHGKRKDKHWLRNVVINTTENVVRDETFKITNENTNNVSDRMRFNRSKPMRGKAKQCILVCFIAITITLALLPSTASADAVITGVYPNFDSTNIDAFQLNGNATLSGDRLQLTPPITDRYGTAWWKNRVSLANNRSFSTYFTFQISESASGGADGIVFVIQTQSSGAGVSGGGMGYDGISPSVGIEFDTYLNWYDLNDNHIGINTNGSMESLKKVNLTESLNAGIWHVWVDYDGNNDSIEVRMNTSSARPESATLAHTMDLEAVFGPDVYVGFTSATGGRYSKHEICSLHFNNDYIPEGITPDTVNYTSAPTTVELTAAPTLIPADGVATSTISATAKDESGTPLSDQTIQFTTTMGTVNPTSAVTNGTGVATTNLLSGTSGGEATVRGSVQGGVYGETQVTFGGKCTCGDICVNETGWWRYVGAFNGNGTPIQAAVDNATAGATICVAAGSYTENVNVNKRLTLAGEGADVVTVTAADSNDPVFEVSADYVNISGFKVTGATNSGMAGIYLNGRRHCHISNNNASGNYCGIYLESSSSNTIYNNYFDNTNNAWDNGSNIWNITPTLGTNIIGGSWLGGNYWSDYAGNDTTGDGLGDTLTPYNSSGNILNGGDYHPVAKQVADNTNDAQGNDAQGGYITGINLSVTASTVKWQGYYGNVTGAIKLRDSQGNCMFEWAWDSSDGGLVFAVARTEVPNFQVVATEGITAGEADDALTADGTWSIVGPDGVAATFGDGADNTEFRVSGKTIEANSRNVMYTLNGSQLSSTFEEVLLTDQSTIANKSDMIWTCIIDGNSENYAYGTSDYQMIVPTDNSANGDTTYYFYIEMQ